MKTDRALRFLIAAGAFVAACAVGAMASTQAAPPRPDIILISIDTLAAKHLELYGYERATAPFLTAWASGAAVFKNSYSASSYTMPSHMSMFTGLSVVHHGVTSFFESTPKEKLDPSVTTMAEMLKHAGYDTAWFGPPADDQLDLKRGFARGFDFISREETMSLMTEERLAWLMNRGKPKFAFFHTYAVHDPYTPRRPHYGKFHDLSTDRIPLDRESFERLAAGKFGKAPGMRARDLFFLQFDLKKPWELKRVEALYDEGISDADAMFRDLIETLTARGLLENTVVIFTSDHGEAFMEHGMMMHSSLHHEILSVPLIVSGPGIRAGTNARPVQGIDLLPTLAELLGLKTAHAMDGESFWPELQGRSSASARTRLFADINAEGSYSVQDETWKFIDFDPGRVALYRRDRDLFEERDVANENPEAVKTYREAIQRRLYDSR